MNYDRFDVTTTARFHDRRELELITSRLITTSRRNIFPNFFKGILKYGRTVLALPRAESQNSSEEIILTRSASINLSLVSLIPKWSSTETSLG
jgi:hypothetical protein